MDVYRYNPKAHYKPGAWPARLWNPDKLNVYVNESRYVRINLTDIFTAYDLHAGSSWLLSNSWDVPLTGNFTDVR